MFKENGIIDEDVTQNKNRMVEKEKYYQNVIGGCLLKVKDNLYTTVLRLSILHGSKYWASTVLAYPQDECHKMQMLRWSVVIKD